MSKATTTKEKPTAAQIKFNKTWDEAEQKAKAIETTSKRRVVPIVIADLDFPKNGNYVVGFMYRPDLTTQLRLADKGQEFSSGFSIEAASKVLTELLIKGESDPRINTDTDEGEQYWKGALFVLFEFLKSAIVLVKKN